VLFGIMDYYDYVNCVGVKLFLILRIIWIIMIM